jgi:hypothetical protein
MSLALIDNLSEATVTLRVAMREYDLSGIEKAMVRFRNALDAVQDVGAWHSDPELKARVKQVMAELESSRMLACLLGDMSSQMQTALAAQNLDAPQPLYGRTR